MEEEIGNKTTVILSLRKTIWYHVGFTCARIVKKFWVLRLFGNTTFVKLYQGRKLLNRYTLNDFLNG